MDEFTRAYVTCALWSSTDDDGEPLDSGRDEDDIAPETLKAMAEECDDFQVYAAKWLSKAYATPNYGESQAGHDFWLTRNGHGAGFWDRGLGKIGDELTKAAKTFGSVDLYIGDDEKIHQ